MSLPLKLLLHLLLDASIFFLLWSILIHGRGHRRQLPILTQYHYAHRGLHDQAAGIPENSLAAFRAAAEQGFGAELDVQLTRDGRLAVIHDASLLRMCGVDRQLGDLTAKELSALRLNGTEEPIPFLEDVLPLFEGKAPLLIELKFARRSGPLPAAVADLLDHYHGDYCIESFDPRPLLWLRRHRPEVIRGQLSKNFFRDEEKLNPILSFFLTNLCLNFLSAPDFIAYRFRDRRSWALRLCKQIYRLPEFSWTIQSPSQQQKAEAEGSTIIFEDFIPRSGRLA